MIIAVDFDDTICVNNKYPSVGPPVPLALEYLKQFQEEEARIILWTMRSDEALRVAVDYLRQNEIRLWGVNENPEQHTWTNSPKAYAHQLIDDAAFGVPLLYYEGAQVVDWAKVGPTMLSQIYTQQPSNRYGI